MTAQADLAADSCLTPEQSRALRRKPAQCVRHGFVQALPFILVLLPFGMLFGVVATDAGLDLPQILGFTVLVLAGASQFTAVQLMTDHAPALVIIVSAIAVNLRMAMYSASLVPWLGRARPRDRAWIAYVLVDQSYALAIQHYEKHPRLNLEQRIGYFLGAVLATCPIWLLATLLGVWLGQAIPEDWALDFAMPITFLALIAPMLRSPAHLAAALVAVVGSLVFAFLPSGLGLFVAAPLAMLTGAGVEVLMERRNGARL
ncbi:AzlC family ABC transporter permease [Paracoccus denitrificans]|uniref:AzlC family protein n=1 Tax=Paracoccus denitrificans (strain Pd 1222) TaxID=318586 RepID=A1AZ49_PARDP|nr:AzlC family ABC transporter permease [Paracoccus denitrificans]ABL68543.1 AzlC family protein [Paracoccus denitrificans PD1222]MBB4625734.1 4-azaleucine resistance transporter AzlC [Paracoccus denitrificans]MCU7427100.1 AzlC family ABC transporter permease [Paracoccus denitrificans]QAR26610.1 branched-chain amino acid ABC transporter permease [Paracoccus denitrificans]UPV95557.1 AzlC family ABC transporter permease [Paracoccus denitrificans]